MKRKFKFDAEKAKAYINLILIISLAAIETVVCAQSYSPDYIPVFITISACCFALVIIEAINLFIIKSVKLKMLFFGVDSVLLLVICLLTGNSFLSTLYCIVLTGCYMTVDGFRDKTIIFGVSCGLFTVSFVIGWVTRHFGASLFDSIVEILSGVLFGLFAIALDFVIVQFIIKFYRTNEQLRTALKEAEESRAQLKDAYEELTNTRVYEERNRIARDIHDNAGHSMTSVIMQTEAAKLLIDENPEEAKSRIISANIQARNALEQMRESVHLLAGRKQSESVSDEIEEIIAQTIDGSDIKVRSDIDDISLPEESYRFVRNTVKELLANGIRHGGATAFYIELKRREGALRLFVSDNGKGVDGELIEGFGLKGIREKCTSLGGECNFSSEKDDGFETEIILPVTEENAE